MSARARLMTVVLFAALICSWGCAKPAPIDANFCRLLAGRAKMSGQLVRVQAVGLFSRHGALLNHGDCPELTAGWQEASEFRRDPSWEMLIGAVVKNERDEMMRPSLDSNDLLVDILATYRWRRNRPEFEVRRVYSATPTSRVYRNENVRQQERCSLGTSVGIEPEKTREACERARTLRGQAR